jgi:hypothetical protein
VTGAARTPEEFFDGHPDGRAIYRRATDVIDGLGEAEVRVSKSQIGQSNEDGGQWPRSGSGPSAGSSSDSGRCQGSELLAGSSSIACTGVSVGCAGS